MGLRFRKSVKLCKGLKVNFGMTGPSLTVGSGAFKKTFHTNGNVTTTVGLPGTGMYWTETERPNSRRNTRQNSSRQRNSRIMDEPQHSYEVAPAVEDYFSEAREPREVVEPVYQPVAKVIEAPAVDEPVETYKYLSTTDIKTIYAFCDEPIEWTELISGATADDLLMDPAKYEYCRGVAPQILAGDIDTYLEVIERIRPIDDLLLYGGDFEFGTDKPSYIEVEFCAKPDSVLSKGVTDNLLEEFCSAVSVRVARDLMALLPVSSVLVHTTIEGDTILSVHFTKSNIAKINFKTANAREIINEFEHLCVENYKQLHHVGRVIS